MKDQEEGISRLLASLKTVEAPEGFEGGVRTRIAERSEARTASQPTIFLVAKFALPLVVLVVLGGFLIVSDDTSVNVNMVPAVADQQQELGVMEESGPEVGAVIEPNGETVTRKSVSTNKNEKSAARALQGGSQDMGLLPDDSTVFPPGVDPRKARNSNLASPPTGKISLDSVLSMIGISADCSSAGCSAKDVRTGSIAANLGVRGGDRIVAINGKSIDEATAVEGRFSLNELTLIRGGSRIVVSLNGRSGH